MPPEHALTFWLRARSPWQQRWLALLAGIVATAAFAPIGMLALLWLSLPILYVLLWQPLRMRQGFWLGWFFGMGHFVTGLYWVAISFFVDAERFAILTPFAVLGLPALLSIYLGLVGALFIRLRRPGLAGLLIFASLWLAAELLRGWAFTGFPWNLMAYASYRVPGLMQVASVTGAYGLSWLIVLLATLPALALLGHDRALAYNLGGLGALALLLIWGGLRIGSAPVEWQPDARLRIVQASIPQHLKWSENARNFAIYRYLTLTMRQNGAQKPTHVIWPETALPVVLNNDSPWMPLLLANMPKDSVLLTGALRMGAGDDGKPLLWNSLIAIDTRRGWVEQYAKVNLVPFGEFVPLREYLPGAIQKITPGDTDFSRGPGPVSLPVAGLPDTQPLICYETIYPYYLPEERPHWLLNVTNDAWFGNSSGPYQHFVTARMRAVEQGVPMIRAANSGISAVIDPYGRVLGHLPLNTVGVIDTALPKPLPGSSFFFRWPYAMIALILVIGVASWLTRRKK